MLCRNVIVHLWMEISMEELTKPIKLLTKAEAMMEEKKKGEYADKKFRG